MACGSEEQTARPPQCPHPSAPAEAQAAERMGKRGKSAHLSSHQTYLQMQWELSWVLFQKINHRAQRVKFLCFWRTRTHGMTFGKDSVISSSTHRHRICAWKHHRLFQVGESALPPVDIPVRSAPTGGDSGEQEGQAPACSLVNSLSETRASRTGQP